MKKSLVDTYGEIAADVQEMFVSPEDLQKRVIEIAQAISIDYAGKDVVIVGVLKGVFCFIADLIRQISIPVAVDFISIAGFSANTPFKGAVRFVKDLDIPVEGRHVLFVEDVVDTGLTLNYLLRNIKTRNPASLEVCTLFSKPSRRLMDIPIRYVGFELPDFFVVGYGLDYRERYRNLPFVGILKSQVLVNHH